MPTSANRHAKLHTVRSELTDVIARLRAYRGYPEEDIALAITHLQRALAEVDLALANAGPQVLAQSDHN